MNENETPTTPPPPESTPPESPPPESSEPRSPAIERRGKAGSDDSTVSHLMKKGAALLVLVVVGVLCWLYLGRVEGSRGGGSPERPEGPPLAVPVQVIESRAVPFSPSVLGQTKASQVVEIRARVAGFLESQEFSEGGKVEKNQLLFRIDPRSYQADVDVARANLESAEATLKRAEAQLRRYESLAETDAATPAELEEWQTAAGVARADVQLAKARLDQAQLDLGYTEIQSPIEGYIGITARDVGSYVDAGSNSYLATVQQTDPIYVSYNISEQDMLQWQRWLGTGKLVLEDEGRLKVEVKLSDGGVYPQEGVIDFVDIAINPADGTAVIRAEVPNAEGFLRPGQFVHIRLLGASLRDTIVVPQRAVMQDPTGASVYVVTKDDTVEQRMVTLGTWRDDMWVVTSGLSPGDRVVADGIAKLSPGEKIDPQPYAVTEAAGSTDNTGSAVNAGVGD